MSKPDKGNNKSSQPAQQQAPAVKQTPAEQQQAPQAPAVQASQIPAVIPQQGSLFAANTMMLQANSKGWQGKVLTRDKKDVKGNVIIDTTTGKAAVDEYGMRISPLNQKQAAEALGLQGKENKPLLEVARLRESDEMLRQAKGTVAALPDSWTLSQLVVKVNRKGEEELILKTKNIKRSPEVVKYAQAMGVPVEELEQFIKERKAKAAKVAENKPPIDV